MARNSYATYSFRNIKGKCYLYDKIVQDSKVSAFYEED
jgi:hypothetical protein